MATKKIYLSPSNQVKNIGIGGYNEAVQMRELAEKIQFYLILSPMFLVRLSTASMNLDHVCEDSDMWGADLHLCLHSDAGPDTAAGTTAFIFAKGGQAEKIAHVIYPKIAAFSPGRDRGIIVRPGLKELNSTNAPAILVENFFHTNKVETDHYKAHMNELALTYAKCIYEFFDVLFPIEEMDYFKAVDTLARNKAINTPEYWKNNNTYNPYYVRKLIINMANLIDK